MTTRATLNHFYCQDDCLGIGATCEVFKGISKGGEIRALKVFGPRANLDMDREINALKNLRHPNIIKFYGIEEELGSRKAVVIMEYCEGGSLLDLINNPENAYGMDEDEFLLLLKHMVAGIEHFRKVGFIHRDIKPANILRSIADDGRSVYKLSDFGTAKPLDDDEFFQSLVGTEEYLHPAIFKAAFFDRDRNRKFDTSADLWSLGATLYHCATGRVPFKPHSGRADKQTMYEMISRKPEGVISGTQLKSQGDVKWSRDLPDMCPFSFSLKKCLTKILAALLETRPKKQYTFDDFFVDINGMLQKESVTVLITTCTTSPFSRVYKDAKQSILHIQRELELETQVKVVDQKLFCDGVCLTNRRESEEPLDSIHLFTSSRPIILISCNQDSKSIISNDPYMEELSGNPVNFPATCQPDIDYKSAKKCRDQVSLLHRQIQQLASCQEHIVQLRRQLRLKMRDRIKENQLKGEFMRRIFADIKPLAEHMLNQETTVWSASLAKTIKQISREVDMYSEGCTQKFFGSQDGSLEEHTWCFEGNACVSKFTQWLNCAKSLCKQFDERRKKRRNSSLDTRMSVVEKKQLTDVLTKSVSHWTDHCYSKTKFLLDCFQAWTKQYSTAENRLDQTEEHLENAKTLLKQLTSQLITKSPNDVPMSSPKSDVKRLEEVKYINTLADKLIEETKGSKEAALSMRKNLDNLMVDLENPEVFDFSDTL